MPFCCSSARQNLNGVVFYCVWVNLSLPTDTQTLDQHSDNFSAVLPHCVCSNCVFLTIALLYFVKLDSTGASSGIGEACARHFAQAGSNLVNRTGAHNQNGQGESAQYGATKLGSRQSTNSRNLIVTLPSSIPE